MMSRETRLGIRSWITGSKKYEFGPIESHNARMSMPGDEGKIGREREREEEEKRITERDGEYCIGRA